MSFSCYREIHLLRFISWHCTSIYKKYFNLLGFVCMSSQTLLISQISIKNFAYHTMFKSITLVIFSNVIFRFRHWIFYLFKIFDFPYASNQKNTPTQRKHWDTGIYCGSVNRVRYYCNRKVLVYNVYYVNNPYS